MTQIKKKNRSSSGMKYKRIRLKFFFLLLCKLDIITAFNCSRNPKVKCILDCVWSTHEGKCYGCPSGFYGKDCSLPYRYPNYGENCQQDCSNCSQQLCNSVVGCLLAGV
ncbi:uncharacterized protein LOC111105023 [Crassostrea virginica]